VRGEVEYSGAARLSRRQALRLLGVGGGLALFSAARPAARLLPASWQAGSSTARKVTFPKDAIIRTILKDLAPEDLANGDILFHEHLDGVYSRTERQLRLPPPSTADIEPVIEDVKDAARNGVICIVDGGHPDMGVNYDHLKQISIQTGVHVVASGGYYVQSTYPAEISSMSDDQIAESLAREASAGRYGAFGEIGQSPDGADFTPDERKVFRAVGKAHLKTNLPIFTHNAYGTGPNVPREAALRQLDLLVSVGVNPQRIAIGHTCCLDDPKAEIIKQLARRGAFVGFDRVTGGRVPDDQKVTMILAFLEAGYADQLLLSSDTRKDYNKTTKVFVPRLRAAGLTEETIHTILVDNPRRFLAFVPKQS
jgi:predicted metal-dependent phosphotriesterase family hydrolase